MEEKAMAFDAFLKIDGIPGESTDDGHTDWIEVLSYSCGISQNASASASSGGGATAERADFSELSIVKSLDKASPKLAVACADGTHIASVVLELCRAGGDKLKYMEYKLTNCIVSTVRPGGSSGGGEKLPLEEVAFNGGGGGQVAGGWNLQTNKKV
jgi:type VI secretion system secreted protein Hcp